MINQIKNMFFYVTVSISSLLSTHGVFAEDFHTSRAFTLQFYSGTLGDEVFNDTECGDKINSYTITVNSDGIITYAEDDPSDCIFTGTLSLGELRTVVKMIVDNDFWVLAQVHKVSSLDI